MRNNKTKQTICLAEDIVFVRIDPETKQAIAHGKTFVQLDIEPSSS